MNMTKHIHDIQTDIFVTQFQSHYQDKTSRSQYHSRSSVKDDNGSNDSSASSSFSNKLNNSCNNNVGTATSVIIAAANAAAVKVRQRKTTRKTGVLYNSNVYSAAGPTNCDISEESSNYTDTSNADTDGEVSANDSEKPHNLNGGKNANITSCANDEDDFFDVHHRPPSPFQHSSGLDQITNRQIDKVINLFRRQAVATSDHTQSYHHTTHSTSNSILEHKRKSTSSKVKNLKIRPRTKKCKFKDTARICSERKYILCS